MSFSSEIATLQPYIASRLRQRLILSAFAWCLRGCGEWIAIDGSKFHAVASIDSARGRVAHSAKRPVSVWITACLYLTIGSIGFACKFHDFDASKRCRLVQ